MPKIVVAEDDEFFRRPIIELLEGAGYDVLQAEDGVEALQKIDDSIDLLITDLRMPKMDGYELIQNLSKQGYSFPIIVCSSCGYMDDCYSGPLSEVPKPFIMRDLLPAVREYV